MSDPYHDEDAEETTMSTGNGILQQNNDPPLVQAFKQMGKTFRNGGFCVERKIEKMQPKSQAAQKGVEVDGTDVSEESSPTSSAIAREIKFDDLGTSERGHLFQSFLCITLYSEGASLLFSFLLSKNAISIYCFSNLLNSGTISCGRSNI